MRLIDADTIFPNGCVTVWECDGAMTADGILKAIKDAPTVDAEPVRYAEWIPWEHNGKAFKHLMTCSGCRRYQWPKSDVLAFDRCPKCGAFMQSI